MMRLFLSQRLFEDCIRMHDTTDSLWKLIRDKLVDVFIDIDATALDEEIQNANMDGCPSMFSLAVSHDIPIYSGKETIQKIKNKGKIKPTPAEDVYIFEGMTKERRNDIQNKYGVLCLSENYKEEMRSLEECKYDDYMDTAKEESISWEKIITTSFAPCNTIVFCDLYLYKDDKNSNNVRNIIASFCKNRIIESQLQIVFIWDGSVNSEEKANSFAKTIFDILPQINNIRIEFILCDKNNNTFKLHEHAHNRRLLTNYSILRSDYTLAIFDEKGIPSKDQGVTYDSIFRGTKSREHDTIIKKIAGDIKYAIINNLDCYPYMVCTKEKQLVNKTKLGNLKNRLIMDYIDLKDGDKCYYLSVPYDNDWLNVKYKSGTYDSSRYQNCICEKEPKPILTKMIEELKRYFGSINFEMPTDDKEPFYWVSTSYPSDLKTVKVQESTPKDKIENCYSKNCFKNREDAEKVVEEIKRILGI